MAKRIDKGRLPPFVPLLLTTLDSRAWRELSHGAQALFVALRRRVPRGRNVAWLSGRHAADELRCSRSQAARWFEELEHYGFIVLAQHGCLGVDGNGKAHHWRLTELGATSKASAGGLFEPATNDFLRWNGTRFKRKDRLHWNLKSRPPVDARVAPRESHHWPPMRATNCGNCPPVEAIEKAPKCPPVKAITSSTTRGRGRGHCRRLELPPDAMGGGHELCEKENDT